MSTDWITSTRGAALGAAILVLLAACGGGGGTGAAGDAASGIVYVQSSASGSAARADFYPASGDGSSSGCVEATQGDCYATACPNVSGGGTFSEPKAGKVTVTVGGRVLTLARAPMLDTLDATFAGPLWTGPGVDVAAVGTGAQVPAFSLHTPSPAAITVTAPAFPDGSTAMTILTEADLPVAWTDGGDCDTVLDLAHGPDRRVHVRQPVVHGPRDIGAGGRSGEPARDDPEGQRGNDRHHREHVLDLDVEWVGHHADGRLAGQGQREHSRRDEQRLRCAVRVEEISVTARRRSCSAHPGTIPGSRPVRMRISGIGGGASRGHDPCSARRAMTWNDVLSATALEQAALVRSRAISSEELCRLYLDRIATHDAGLNAFVSVHRRRALANARAKDAMVRGVRRGESLPTFDGVPIGIKDLNVVRFSWTRFGSRGALPLFSPVDDRTTAALRRGGFVILGKTSTSELGTMPVTEPDIHPPTRNPWNPEHTPGGSSGGSAAAVAAGLLPIAQGSDGGGSVRIPSALCHLYGLKPSRGRVANAFGKPDRDVLYTCGPIARSVEDAAAMLDVMAGLDVGRPHWAPPPEKPYREQLAAAPRKLRVRFMTRAPFGETDPEVAAAAEQGARLLASLGHEVTEGALPEGTVEEVLPLWQHLIASVPAILSRTQPVTRWLAEAGRPLRAPDVTALLQALAARFLRDLGDADLWVTPTVAMPAPRVGFFAGMPPAEAFRASARFVMFTAAFNVTGQPAASVPLGLTRGGLPMGLQVAARLYREDDVLMVSRQLEEAIPWRGRTAQIGDGPALRAA